LSILRAVERESLVREMLVGKRRAGVVVGGSGRGTREGRGGRRCGEG